MVVSARTKNRKSPTVQLDYLIHVQEIKPWPPSQSLRTLRSVLIQWESGDRNSGSTKPVGPSLGSGIGDGQIEFDESFRLPVTLLREKSNRGGFADTFQKNCLEFNLYETRRDKTVKGQLLGTAIIDLAAYGIVKESLRISVPVNSKRSFSNTAQPLLFIKIQTIEKGGTTFSSRDNLSKVASMERNGGESVSALMNEEYAEEAETASITDDDDVSSHSSLAVSSSAFESNGGLSLHSEENGFLAVKDCSGEAYHQNHVTSVQGHIKIETQNVNEAHESLKVEKAADGGNEINCNDVLGSDGYKPNGSVARVTSLDCQDGKKLRFAVSVESQVHCGDTDEVWSPSIEAMYGGAIADVRDSPANGISRKEHQENGQDAEVLHERLHSTNGAWNTIPQSDNRDIGSSESDALSFSEENPVLKSNIFNGDRLKHVKSVRSLADSVRSNGSPKGGKLGDFQNGPRGFVGNERKDTKIYSKETRNISSDGRIQQLERRIKVLEGELREAAATEVGLYSVVAEHGSSITKVHAPARRLSRLYLHACKESSHSRRASAAKSAVSGLVLVAKACGNDVPRLTFWLSNSVVLRAIISRGFAESHITLSSGIAVERPGGGKGNHKKLSPLTWSEFSSSKEIKNDDWEDPLTFTTALEKVEAWIFSRIIESVWWQTLTPPMQSAAAKAINTGVASDVSKTYRRTSSSSDQEQVIFSLELWKKAFKDACERLCPVRAGGHECGCLPVLARLIMEQCVARLDVAMFNAILRESGDEIPTDPVSDPISDANVLPIQAGEASFGAGAQLKNAIGNWSRWLTDVFGIDDDDSLEEKNDNNNHDEVQKDYDTSFKSFHLLNALSDLMMLPKDMLLSRSIRKEVCPIFGAPLIKRILNNFVPDEFCPDPIPEIVLEALDSEDPLEDGEGIVTNFPCSAAPIVYLPPAAASVAGIINGPAGQSLLRRSGSSVHKKSYTSDDELDELESPLTAIISSFQASPTPTKPSWLSKENGNRNTVRYQLLREVWMNSE